jgi:hypothetical protein
MKSRKGFISNSSSSSFIVLLPKDFKIEDIDLSKYKEEAENQWGCDEECIKQDLEKLLKEKEVWDESSETNGFLNRVLEDYVILELNDGPDSGRVILLEEKSIDKIKTILEIKS